MTLKEFIEVITDLASDQLDVEVVCTDRETGESYTPAVGIGPDKDGIRRLFLN